MGSTATFQLSLSAPSSGTSAVTAWQMFDSSTGFFGPIVSQSISLVAGGADAAVADAVGSLDATGSADTGLADAGALMAARAMRTRF
jgi:hypothetical protein